MCLYVSYGRLNVWANFKNILHVNYPWVGDGLGKKKFLKEAKIKSSVRANLRVRTEPFLKVRTEGLGSVSGSD